MCVCVLAIRQGQLSPSIPLSLRQDLSQSLETLSNMFQAFLYLHSAEIIHAHRGHQLWLLFFNMIIGDETPVLRFVWQSPPQQSQPTNPILRHFCV